MNNTLIPLLLFALMSPAPMCSFERGAGYWTTPADEGSTAFFKALTASQSQRENWYAVTPYIAEFWCALSNAGFIYAGIKNKSPELVFAGCASIASHAIPKQWLLYVDKLGVALVVLKAIRERATLQKNPKLLLPIIALGLINGADAYLARNKGFTWPHVLWHLSAAYISNSLLQQIPQTKQL